MTCFRKNCDKVTDCLSKQIIYNTMKKKMLRNAYLKSFHCVKGSMRFIQFSIKEQQLTYEGYLT